MLRQATKKLSAGLNLRAAANWGSLQAFNRGKASESNHGSNLPKKMGTLSPPAARARRGSPAIDLTNVSRASYHRHHPSWRRSQGGLVDADAHGPERG